MIAAMFPPDSSFSRAVYNEIRQAIPRGQWPSEALTATFTVAPDGLSLHAVFEGLPQPAAAVAAQVVARAKVGLILASPVAVLAGQVVKARRWRDTFLFALLPLLFAIPLMAALGDTAMRVSTGLCALDAATLFFTHAMLMQARSRANSARFVAMIPVPGLRIKPTPSSTATPLAEG